MEEPTILPNEDDAGFMQFEDHDNMIEKKEDNMSCMVHAKEILMKLDETEQDDEYQDIVKSIMDYIQSRCHHDFVTRQDFPITYCEKCRLNCFWE